MLLHYNGASDPLDREIFFQGHWLYYQGTTVLQNMEEEDKQVTIKVKDASVFNLKIGRNKNKNDDIMFLLLEWNEGELLSSF